MRELAGKTQIPLNNLDTARDEPQNLLSCIETLELFRAVRVGNLAENAKLTKCEIANAHKQLKTAQREVLMPESPVIRSVILEDP